MIEPSHSPCFHHIPLAGPSSAGISIPPISTWIPDNAKLQICKVDKPCCVVTQPNENENSKTPCCCFAGKHPNNRNAVQYAMRIGECFTESMPRVDPRCSVSVVARTRRGLSSLWGLIASRKESVYGVVGLWECRKGEVFRMPTRGRGRRDRLQRSPWQ